MNIAAEPVVGPSSAARTLGISSRQVVNLIEAGKLDALKTELGRLISVREVERLAEERAAQAATRVPADA